MRRSHTQTTIDAAPRRFRCATISLAISVIAFGLFGFATSARAATGDLLGIITISPVPPCEAVFNVGVAFDGSELLITCVSNNIVTRIDSRTGANLGSITIDGVPESEGIGPISWDRKNNQLWLATSQVTPPKIYTAVLDKASGKGTATLRFMHTQGGTSLTDGLAFDGNDDSIWFNIDVGSVVWHYTLDGKLKDPPNIPAPGAPGNSGIAVATPSTLYLIAGNSNRVFSVSKDGQTKSLIFDTQGNGWEDIECDGATFASQGKTALWVMTPIGNKINAFEVPAGQCAQGGIPGPVPPLPGPAPTPTPPPSPGPPPPPAPSDVCPPTAPFFPETGFCIDDPEIQAYFQGRGGVDTFGFPVSRSFLLLGFPAQVFQRHILRVHPDGVKPMNLLDPDVLPVTTVNGATFPAHDPAVATSAPPPNTPNFGQAVLAHLQANVPDSFEGVSVQFLQAYLAAGQQAAQQGGFAPLVALEIWGFPTSRPARDPNNANFIYQRFQRAILHSFPDPTNPANRVTRGILLADNLKFVLTNDPVQLPADLRAQVQNSRFFNQYCPTNPAWLCRPAELPDTDLTGAFEKQRQ